MDMTEAEWQAVLDGVRSRNPGTEIWEGGTPKTGDRYIYRAAIKSESKIFRKLTREQREKGELADFDLSNEMLAMSCVLWPPKAKDDPNAPLTLEMLFAKRPMISAGMAEDITEVSGAGERSAAKKL